MRNCSQGRIWKFAVFFATLLATANIASAQALIAAQRGAEITPFAQFTLVNPDWGPTTNFGYTAGLDYTHFVRSRFIQPSLEFRYTGANGVTVNERTYAGGFKFQAVDTFHGIRPYAIILAGHGNIDFNYFVAPNYHGDNSFVLVYGGGAEFNVTSLIKARVDVTSQSWNTDTETLTPFTVGVGLAYSLPTSRNRRVE